MANGVNEWLLAEAGRFRRWQEANFPGEDPENIGGAWEVDYPGWDSAWRAFCHVLTEVKPDAAGQELLDAMLFLIGRDNEAEFLIAETAKHPDWFAVLCLRAADSGENEAKWQFAAYLPKFPEWPAGRELLVRFAQDSHEYVSRRALLAMPELCPEQAERFAALFWNKTCYPDELQEYQRIAVLVSLDAAHSSLLLRYLAMAHQAGGRYLLEHAERIEKKADKP